MSGMGDRARRFLRDASGAGAAEFALVLPTFLLLVFCTINAGMAMSALTQVHYAAERSARCLAVDVASTCTSGNIDTYAKTIYDGPPLTGLSFTLTPGTSCGKQVVGTGSFDLLTGLHITAVTIRAAACYPII